MILELLALAALLRVDPAGDAHGAGDLVPPSAALYADRSPFDLLEVEVGGDEFLTVRIRVAGIPNPGRLPNGLTLPVIDVYLDLDEGGERLTLPGVGMALSGGRGWEVALRVHGDDAYARLANDPEGASRPVGVTRRGDDLMLTTSLPAPETVLEVQAVTGVYDPFSRDAWRPLSPLPSPWAFSSEVPAPPVVDLLASSDATQQSAIRSYVLPPARSSSSPVAWLLLMFVGLGLATAGLWLRRRVPGHRPSSVEETAPEPALAQGDVDAEPKKIGANDIEPSFWLEEDDAGDDGAPLHGSEPRDRVPTSNWTAADWGGAPASTRRTRTVVDETEQQNADDDALIDDDGLIDDDALTDDDALIDDDAKHPTSSEGEDTADDERQR